MLHRQYIIGIRVTIAVQAGLAATSLLRRSKALLAFWLPEMILTVFVLCFREKRWELNRGYFNSSLGGVIESVFWLALLAGLTVWLVGFLLRCRAAAVARAGAAAFSLHIRQYGGGIADFYGRFPGWL